MYRQAERRPHAQSRRVAAVAASRQIILRLKAQPILDYLGLCRGDGAHLGANQVGASVPALPTCVRMQPFVWMCRMSPSSC